MMAAPIAVVGAGLKPGAPVVLFPTRIVGGGVEARQGQQYDVAPDGRFLINTELPGDVAPITLIQNWQPDARRSRRLLVRSSDVAHGSAIPACPAVI